MRSGFINVDSQYPRLSHRWYAGKFTIVVPRDGKMGENRKYRYFAQRHSVQFKYDMQVKVCKKGRRKMTAVITVPYSAQ